MELVYLPTPTAGTWTLRVAATKVPGNPAEVYSDHQGFALVATYADCVSSLTAPSGLTAVEAPGTGINLSWTAVPGASAYQIYRAAGACGQGPGEFHYAGQTTGTAFVDALIQGGYEYAYVVRAADACSEGPSSGCVGAAFTGDCTLFPAFSGLDSAENNPSSSSCGVLLTWSAATARCPLGAGISYNIYRGISPYFTPGPRRSWRKARQAHRSWTTRWLLW